MNMHLGGAVHIKIRIACSHIMEQTIVLYEQRVHIRVIQKIDILDGIGDLALIKHRVHRHIDFHIADMGISDRLKQLLTVEIAGKGSCRKVRHAKINGIRPARNRSFQRIHTAGRCQQFRFFHKEPP